MSLVQLIECAKCGYNESIPYDPAKLPKMPWEVWPKGCPKCSCTRVDVTIIVDKSGAVEDAKIIRADETEDIVGQCSEDLEEVDPWTDEDYQETNEGEP